MAVKVAECIAQEEDIFLLIWLFGAFAVLCNLHIMLQFKQHCQLEVREEEDAISWSNCIIVLKSNIPGKDLNAEPSTNQNQDHKQSKFILM